MMPNPAKLWNEVESVKLCKEKQRKLSEEASHKVVRNMKEL
jgi:hypothetical protein